MIYKYDESNMRVITTGFSVVDIYKDNCSDMDYVIVNLNGEHGLCSNKRSTKYWIILEGNAKIYLNDKIFEANQGDFIVIERNVKHNIIWKVKFGVLCTPTFDSSTEEYY